MSGLGLHPVSSKEHMLIPTDIFAVAAHEDKERLEGVKQAAKKIGVSPERFAYSMMIQEYSDPKLIRIRAGNTLFTIAAFPKRVGFVRGYNADVAKIYIGNMIELFEAGRKMGFDYLVAHTSNAVVQALKVAIKNVKQDDFIPHFDSRTKMFMLKTGKPRAE